MKKGKITIIILSILLTISVIGNIALIIMVNTNDNVEIKEETKEKPKEEEYNFDSKYVGKWEYGYSSEESFILSNGSSAKGLDSYSSILEIDNNLNVTMTKETRSDCLNADGSQVLTVINKEIYKGEVRDSVIIFKEKLDNDATKEEIRETHNIVLYSDDTLGYYRGIADEFKPLLFIKR